MGAEGLPPSKVLNLRPNSYVAWRTSEINPQHLSATSATKRTYSTLALTLAVPVYSANFQNPEERAVKVDRNEKDSESMSLYGSAFRQDRAWGRTCRSQSVRVTSFVSIKRISRNERNKSFACGTFIELPGSLCI